MMNPSKLLLTGLISLISIGTYAPAGQADEFDCVSNLDAITVDNLRVPDGATCTLNGTQVKGNILVESDAVLIATGVFVDGDVQAENAAQVVVEAESVVGGNIQIKQSGEATVVTTQIGGDLQFDENTQALVSRNNTIGGNLQAFKNLGGLAVFENRIDGNLQCKENSPFPNGGNNTVGGNKEDQCAEF